MKYSEPRYTKDLDLWIDTSEENAAAVFQALKEFGAPLSNLTDKDFSNKGYFYQMGRPPMRVDIMMAIPGVEFEESWNNRVMVLLNGIEVPFISKPDLIKSKEAGDRDQDIADLKRLQGK